MVAIRRAVLLIGEYSENFHLDTTDHARFLERFASRRDLAGLAGINVAFRNAPSAIPTAADEKDFEHSIIPAAVTDRTRLRNIASGGNVRRISLRAREHGCFRFLPISHTVAIALDYDS